MKKLIIILSAVALFACQSTRDEFTLKGTVAGQDTGMVYLQDRVAGLMNNIDSTNIENGQFVLKGKVDFQQMYYLKIDGVPARISVFVENAEINVNVEQMEPLVYTVTGSESHDIYKKSLQIAEKYDETSRQLNDDLVAAEAGMDTAKADQLRNDLDNNEIKKTAEIKEFVKQYSDKSVGVFIARNQLMYTAGPVELREIFSGFDASLKGTRYYDEMETNVLALEKVAIGQPAVDFTLDTPDGQQVSLSDLKGKIVLISFWASWCPSCRAANPELVKVYENYGGKGFEVIGVSLDREKGAWIKGIEDDGLKWIHVSDLKGWQSGPAGEYAVRSIPQNVLIDANGIIIGRGLKYKELGEKLDTLLINL